MNLEELKLGEMCDLIAKYKEACKALESRGIDPFNMQNDTKNTETAPKYDPCRKLRRGDRVRVVERNGRIPICFPVGRIQVGDIVTVAENETGDVFIKVLTEDGHEMMAPWFMLELVTPVEELVISRVFNDKKMGAWIVTKDNFTHAYFPYRCEVCDNIANSKEEAKVAAEAERDRLNDEYRKEQK